MVLVRITGGLGNQMFQYAAAKYVALKTGEVICFDTSFFKNPNHAHEVFRLNEFKLEGVSFKRIFSLSIFYNHWFFRKIPGIRRLRNSFQVDILQKEFIYSIDDLKIEKNSYVNGLWHTVYFANANRNVLLKEFFPKTIDDERFDLVKDLIVSKTTVSLHVRRNDFVNHQRAKSISGALANDYYGDAMNYFNSHYQNVNFVVFSDDIQWCRDNFVGSEFLFIDPFENPIYDMLLMSFCNHHILANSTFSWWGAWLNSKLSKDVVYPKSFYKNKSNDEIKFMFDEEWIEM
jgi:hypothetical protein